MLGLLLLTAITTFHPARPTVGDPITIDFASPTVVDPSPDYEVVSRGGNRVVIRTFVPHTIAVTGRAAEGPVSVMIPIHSVLKPDDKLEPAPLKPPKTRALAAPAVRRHRCRRAGCDRGMDGGCAAGQAARPDAAHCRRAGGCLSCTRSRPATRCGADAMGASGRRRARVPRRGSRRPRRGADDVGIIGADRR